MPPPDRPKSAHFAAPEGGGKGLPSLKKTRPQSAMPGRGSGASAGPSRPASSLSAISTTQAQSRPYSALSSNPASSRPLSALSGGPGMIRREGPPGRPTSWNTTAATSSEGTGRRAAGGDPVLSEIVQVSGQLWLGQLVSLMRSVNKWPISLDLKAISASVCGKACALVQAASAALFLVDAENSELLLIYSPAIATGRGRNTRVPIGRGLVGATAERGTPMRTEDVKNEVEYEKEYDLFANKQGSVGAPDSMLCVPMLDAAGNTVAVVQVISKKMHRVFQPEDEAMLTLLGMQAAVVLQCADLHARDRKQQEETAAAHKKTGEYTGATDAEMDAALLAGLEHLAKAGTGLSADSLIRMAAEHAQGIAGADLCTVFLSGQALPPPLGLAALMGAGEDDEEEEGSEEGSEAGARRGGAVREWGPVLWTLSADQGEEEEEGEYAPREKSTVKDGSEAGRSRGGASPSDAGTKSSRWTGTGSPSGTRGGTAASASAGGRASSGGGAETYGGGVGAEEEEEEEVERVGMEASSDTSAGWAFLNRTPLEVPNIFADARFNKGRGGGEEEGQKCGVLCLPIMGKLGRALGVVEVIKMGGRVGRAEQQRLDRFTIGLAEAAARLHEEGIRGVIAGGCRSIAQAPDREAAYREAAFAASQLVPGSRVGVFEVAPPAPPAKPHPELRLAWATGGGEKLSPRPFVLDGLSAGRAGLLGHVALRGEAIAGGDVREMEAAGGVRHTEESVAALWGDAPGERGGGVEGETVALAACPARAPTAGGDPEGRRTVLAVLCVVREGGGVGLLGEMSLEEVMGLEALADEMGSVLAKEAAIATHRAEAEEYAMLARMLPQLLSEFDLRSLLRIATQDVMTLTDAPHVTPYMVDAKADQIWTRVEGLRREVRLPRRQGAVGGVATSGVAIIVSEGAEVGTLGLGMRGGKESLTDGGGSRSLSGAGSSLSAEQSLLSTPSAAFSGGIGVRPSSSTGGFLGRSRLSSEPSQIQEEDAEGVFDPRLLTSGLAFGGDGEVSRVESMLAVPVLGVKGEVVAVLQALHPQKNAFRQRHLTLVSMYARMLSVALQNQKLAVARLRDLQRGVPVDWPREKVHLALTSGLKKLLDCESVVIHERAGPWNKVVSLKPGETGMREFPQDVGVVGFVLKSGNAVMSERAEMLPSFDRQIDQPSGKQVRSLLCCPLQDGYSHCNGVVMATHKRVGSFSRSDEALLKALCVQYGEILASREKFQELQRNNETLSFLLSASRSLSSQTALPDIVSAAQKLAADLVKCEASNIFVHDPENRSLFTFHPSGRLISVPISDASVVGVCFSLGEALRIEDVYMDERFKRQRSALVEQGGNALSRGGGAGFGERRQCAMLCSPVIRKGEVLAVVQLVRTFDPSLSSPAGSAQEAFSGAEEQRLQEFAQMVAMPSLNAFQANRPAYRVLDLVDDLSLLASEVRNREALLINLKRIVRQNLLCEKVNVYSIDLVRQELTMESHLALQDDMDHIQAEIDSVADGLSPRAGHSAEVKARRATLVKDLELIKRKAEDLENSVVRMPFGVGIAGRVAATGGSANLREVTRREALESEMTSVGGGESKTMLLHCAYDATGEIVALIQAINKRQGNFTRDDEQLLARLSGQAGIMLRHTAVVAGLEKAAAARFRISEFALLASSCSSEERLAALVAQEGTLLIGARRCTLWLLDSASKSVSSVDESGVAKVVKVRDLANSVVGMAAISCELQTQELGAREERNEADDREEAKTNEGRPTKNRDALWKSCSLGQPVLGRQTSGELLGVIECVNKRGGAFDDDDKYFIDIFASVTAATLDSLRLIKSLKARAEQVRQHSGAGHPPDEGGSGTPGRRDSSGSAAGSSVPTGRRRSRPGSIAGGGDSPFTGVDSPLASNPTIDRLKDGSGGFSPVGSIPRNSSLAFTRTLPGLLPEEDPAEDHLARPRSLYDSQPSLRRQSTVPSPRPASVALTPPSTSSGAPGAQTFPETKAGLLAAVV